MELIQRLSLRTLNLIGWEIRRTEYYYRFGWEHVKTQGNTIGM